MAALMIRRDYTPWGIGGSHDSLLVIFYQFFTFLASFGCLRASKTTMVCNNLHYCSPGTLGMLVIICCYYDVFLCYVGINAYYILPRPVVLNSNYLSMIHYIYLYFPDGLSCCASHSMIISLLQDVSYE